MLGAGPTRADAGHRRDRPGGRRQGAPDGAALPHSRRPGDRAGRCASDDGGDADAYADTYSDANTESDSHPDSHAYAISNGDTSAQGKPLAHGDGSAGGFAESATLFRPHHHPRGHGDSDPSPQPNRAANPGAHSPCGGGALPAT